MFDLMPSSKYDLNPKLRMFNFAQARWSECELTNQPTERSLEGWMLFRFVSDPDKPSPGSVSICCAEFNRFPDIHGA
jgi:hypothetical protein